MQYNPATTYRRAGMGNATISLVGQEGGIISSIPFFAGARNNYTSVSSQADPLNMKDLPAAGNTETVVYFGCWLDFNQPAQTIPLTNDTTHAVTPVNLQTSIRGIHQCLVAEVFFAGDPTQPNATPGSSDNLSQRNLAIANSDNPGSSATHTLQHTFEIKPSQFNLTQDAIDGQIIARHTSATANVGNDQLIGPDLLLIHWNNLPRESKIIVYMPEVKVDDIIALEPYTRLTPTQIIKEDEHSFSFISSDINYIPIPGGFIKNIPGLLTIELPSTVVKGQLFKVLVQQARFYRNTRRIIGSFQFNIPVSTAEQILTIGMRNLSILKYVRQSMPVTDPWRMIFNRYIKGLSDKVNGLGGKADNVPASPNDKWLVAKPDDKQSDDVLIRLFNYCCKRISILLLLLILLLFVLAVFLFIKLK